MRNNHNRGFSVIELIVALGIFGIIMGVVLFNYGSSGDSLAVSASGQELSVAIRQAQVYGLSVKESSSGSGQFSYAYGVFVSPSSAPSDYLIFVDKNNNRIYDVGAGSCGTLTTECVEKQSFRNGIRISSIEDGSGSMPSGAVAVSITFLRPNPDAVVKFTNGSGGVVSTGTKAKVNLISPRGKIYSVTVSSNGQILAQ